MTATSLAWPRPLWKSVGQSAANWRKAPAVSGNYEHAVWPPCQALLLRRLLMSIIADFVDLWNQRTPHVDEIYRNFPNQLLLYTSDRRTKYKKLIRRWDSERELSLRRHRTPTTKYKRLVHKFRHRSTRLCVGTHVYQIQRNNAM